MKTKKSSKTQLRNEARERANNATISYTSLRGFKAIVAYVQRFPYVARQRMLKAALIVCE